LIISNYYTALI